MATHSPMRVVTRRGVFSLEDKLMSYDARKVAAEIPALISERRIDPDIVIGHTYLSSFADGSVPLPLTNIPPMLKLAFSLRVEPRYLYSICGHPVPQSLNSAIAQRIVVHDRGIQQRHAARRARRAGAVEEPAPQVQTPDPDVPTQGCLGPCGKQKPLDQFYKSARWCKSCMKHRGRDYREARKARKTAPAGDVVEWWK
jgi:hypothetical protein